MRRSIACVLILGGLGCGARTDLRVERSDAGPPPPCELEGPERFSDTRATLLAADGARLWASGLDGLGVGTLDRETGDIIRIVRDEQLGARTLVARDGQAWWAHAGFSDFAGELVHADARGGSEVVHAGLFQPGGVQLGGDWVYYAEWTNSGRLTDEMRGRVLRVSTRGGAVQELARGLGLPTDTALTPNHLYWVDRRRSHVARVPVDGGPSEVVVSDVDVASAIAAHGGGVFFADGPRLVRLDTLTLATEEIATVEGDVRGLLAIEEGLLVTVFSGGDPVGNTLVFVPAGRDEPIALQVGGSAPVAAPRRIFYGVDTAGRAPGLMQVCRSYLASL